LVETQRKAGGRRSTSSQSDQLGKSRARKKSPAGKWKRTKTKYPEENSFDKSLPLLQERPEGKKGKGDQKRGK